MNAKQIEHFLELVDGSLDMTRNEASEYIREHQAEIVKSLASNGYATIRTSGGNIRIDLKDLELVAA